MIQPSEMQLLARSKVIVLGLLLAALMSLMLIAKPAHADTTFTVTSTVDPGDGLCNSSCTLRDAILAANATTGADRINFNISGSGVKTIFPASELPPMTDAVTIDGYTQGSATPDPSDDARANTLGRGTNANLLIQLDGIGAGQFADGLRITADNVVVRGLVIKRFPSAGIEILDVASDPDKPTGVRIEGNFIGTDTTGTLDAGNGFAGVRLLDGKNNTIGGTTPAARNLISGNDRAGVELLGGSSSNKLRGNLIGTEKDGISPLGNEDDGVEIFGSSNNTLGGATASAANTIAFNGENGVVVGNGESPIDFTGNRILSNSIFSNTRLGIDLLVSLENDGPTANDPGDADSGANDLQNKPTITSATAPGGFTTFGGRLNSVPNKSFRIEFFSNPAGTDEGRKFIGSRSVTTNAEGKVSFTFSPTQKVDVGRTVTATATDPDGNSSEFSAPRTVATQ